MYITVRDILDVVDKIPQKERAKWKGITFVIEEKVLVIQDNGTYRAGEWSNGGIITLFSDLIHSKEQLKKVILHEIAHHLGLEHKMMDSSLL